MRQPGTDVEERRELGYQHAVTAFAAAEGCALAFAVRSVQSRPDRTQVVGATVLQPNQPYVRFRPVLAVGTLRVAESDQIGRASPLWLGTIVHAEHVAIGNDLKSPVVYAIPGSIGAYRDSCR